MGNLVLSDFIFLIMFAAKIFNFAPDLSWWIVFSPLIFSCFVWPIITVLILEE